MAILGRKPNESQNISVYSLRQVFSNLFIKDIKHHFTEPLIKWPMSDKKKKKRTFETYHYRNVFILYLVFMILWFVFSAKKEQKTTDNSRVIKCMTYSDQFTHLFLHAH